MMSTIEPGSPAFSSLEELCRQAAASSAAVLIHIDGQIAWGNRSFSRRFGVPEDSLVHTPVKELLWCLGIHEAIAGMVAEGMAFRHCEVPWPDAEDNVLCLRQFSLILQPGDRRHVVLVLSDAFDPVAVDFPTGHH